MSGVKIKQKYYFFHIPKTAGTSLTNIIEDIFPREEVYTPHLLNDLVKCTPSDLSKYSFFRGHFYRCLYQIIGNDIETICFFRDPVERAISHYGHVVRDSNHYYYARAQELGSLEAFLKDEMTSKLVSNFQARSLIMDSPIADLYNNNFDSTEEKLALERGVETSTIPLSDTELLKVGKRRIDELDFIGMTEMFQESVELLAKKYKWKFKSDNMFLNEGSNRLSIHEITPIEKRLLEDLNAVDIQLYEYATEKFHQQKNNRLFMKFFQRFFQDNKKKEDSTNSA